MKKENLLKKKELFTVPWFFFLGTHYGLSILDNPPLEGCEGVLGFGNQLRAGWRFLSYQIYQAYY